MSIAKVVKPLADRISNMLARGVVTLVNSAGKMQALQVALLADETKDTVEHFEAFGHTSNPMPGAEVLVVFVEGDRSHGVVLSATDRRYRPQNLLSGESAVYNAYSMSIKLTKEGIVIAGGTKDINISGAPNINISDSTVHVNNGDVIADGIGLKTHHHDEHDSFPTSAAKA